MNLWHIKFRDREPDPLWSALVSAGLAIMSAVISLAAAERLSQAFLPEVSDTFIVRLSSVKEKYHHPLAARELPAPDPAAHRVLFLGDSFTWGMKGPEHSFPALVGAYFGSGEVPGVPRLRVQSFNLGNPSYSPSIYGAVLRDLAPQIRPQLVVIAVDDSDPQDDYMYRDLLLKDQDGLPLSVYPDMVGVPEWLKPLARELKIIRLPLGLIFQHRIRSSATTDSSDIRGWHNRYSHYRPENAALWEAAFQRSLDLISAMFRWCQANGIRVALVNYPYAPAVTAEHNAWWRKEFRLDDSKIYDPPFHARQKDLAATAGVPYYDFTPYLRSLRDHAGLYDTVNAHFTDAANGLFAAELARFIYPLLSGPSRGKPRD